MKPLRSRFLAALAACLFLGVASCDRPGSSFGARANAAAPPIVASDAARLAASSLDSLLEGKTPSPSTRNFFSTYDNTTHTYKRNPDCIAARVDTTCVSVANSSNADGTGGNRGCVTMVTPLHGVTNNHFMQPYAAGVVHYFVDRTNTVYPRKVVKAEQVGDSDLEVVTFDSPLPASVHPAQLLPAGVIVRALSSGTPLLATNQQKQAILTELAGIMGKELVVRSALAANRQPWTASPPAVLGDSDSPTFVVIGQRPFLLFTYHTSASGPAVSEYLPAIKSLLSGGYSLDVAAVE